MEKQEGHSVLPTTSPFFPQTDHRTRCERCSPCTRGKADTYHRTGTWGGEIVPTNPYLPSHFYLLPSPNLVHCSCSGHFLGPHSSVKTPHTCEMSVQGFAFLLCICLCQSCSDSARSLRGRGKPLPPLQGTEFQVLGNYPVTLFLN